MIEKNCSRCGRLLPIECFHKDRKGKDGYKTFCKDCLNKRKEEYERLKHPCEKCGENRMYLIQFHHIDPSTKLFDVTHGGGKNRNISEEVKKCVCLCSNCHDEFHYFYGKVPKYPKESLEEYLGVKL